MAARYKERVGERIKAAREALKWSQARLAQEMPGSLDSASISRWETGKVEPRADNLQALADVLGVDPSFFLVPAPEPGTGDLMGALSTDETQLDRIEGRLDRIDAILDQLLAEQDVGAALGLKDALRKLTDYLGEHGDDDQRAAS